ncbi:hypothetical protein [Oerskovia flava]|uniref:hypothetical protein n=1 Tax=Oerskovia flava TaxID=2986422 RepID=UPI002240606E|nr:hypothetical protein [Oerskovia sp. JB1-3-2]
MGASVGSACEHSGGAPWAEPLSTATSLAFVAVGLALWLTRTRRSDAGAPPGTQLAFALLVALVGVGSVVQHGPAPSWNPVAHDPPLFGVLALVAADALADLTGRRMRTWWWLVPTLGCVVLAAVSTTGSMIAQVVTAVVAVGASLLRAWWRPAVRARLLTAMALLAVGSAVGTLSRTGWLLCDPGSWFQGHALWHVLAAAALWVLAPTLGTHVAPQHEEEPLSAR